MSRPGRSFAGLASVLCAGVIASACGGGTNLSSESAAQIVQAASTALESATSTTINGSERQGAKTVTISATIFSNGDVEGTVVQDGDTAQIVKIGGTDYIKATAGYYESNGSPVNLAMAVAGRWIYIPDQRLGLGGEFSFNSLANQFTGTQTGTISKGTTARIDGQPAVAVLSVSEGTVWVATSGPPYPIEVVPPPSQGTGSLTFSNWNRGTLPLPPPGARPGSQYGTNYAVGSGVAAPAN